MENLTRLFWRSYADVDNRLYLLKRDILLFLDTISRAVYGRG